MKHTNKRHPLDVRKKLDLTSKQKKNKPIFVMFQKKPNVLYTIELLQKKRRR